MEYKCQNKTCGEVTEEPRDVDSKLYCPICNYEVEEAKEKKPWKHPLNEPGLVPREDLKVVHSVSRLEQMTQAVATGILLKGKLSDRYVAKESVRIAKEIIEELDKDE